MTQTTIIAIILAIITSYCIIIIAQSKLHHMLTPDNIAWISLYQNAITIFFLIGCGLFVLCTMHYQLKIQTILLTWSIACICFILSFTLFCKYNRIKNPKKPTLITILCIVMMITPPCLYLYTNCR